MLYLHVCSNQLDSARNWYAFTPLIHGHLRGHWQEYHVYKSFSLEIKTVDFGGIRDSMGRHVVSTLLGSWGNEHAVATSTFSVLSLALRQHNISQTWLKFGEVGAKLVGQLMSQLMQTPKRSVMFIAIMANSNEITSTKMKWHIGEAGASLADKLKKVAMQLAEWRRIYDLAH